jgi:Cyclin, N-terminal domain
MHFVDRFLSLPAVHQRVKKAEYQLIGAVCLFITSKFIDCSEEICMSASQIVGFTDHSITRAQLLVGTSSISAPTRSHA